MPDPVLETASNPAPNAQADAPPAPAPAGPPPLGLVVFALRAGTVYLDRFVHDAPFRAALGELEAPALASVQAAVQGQIGPEVVLAALEVCDFYADFGGPLEDAFQDLLDEHAGEVLANVRYAAGTTPAPA